MIPILDLRKLSAGEPESMKTLHKAATDVGFFLVEGTTLSAERVTEVIEAYRTFFKQPMSVKEAINMANTGANRGWGAPASEQVNPDANPDYKQVFDTGFDLPQDDPMAELSVYAPNMWPDDPAFRAVVEGYYKEALIVANQVLDAVIASVGLSPDRFQGAFEKPMALLRGNFYPERPDWAGAKDFGIAPHTDYGCLTLLAIDGLAGLEVLGRDGAWIPVKAQPGRFVVNFGEMLERWTSDLIVATEHRVVGSLQERISVPMFYNPSYDTNVAPDGQPPFTAGDHLRKRFEETYLHLKAS